MNSRNQERPSATPNSIPGTSFGWMCSDFRGRPARHSDALRRDLIHREMKTRFSTSVPRPAGLAMRSFIYILGAQLVTVSLFPANGANEKTVEAARKYSAEAGKSVAHGAFDAAIDNWKAAENAWRKTGDQGEQIDALINLASAYHALGQQKLAVESLGKAMELASTMKDSARSAAVYSSLGAVQTLSHKADSAEENLQKALSLARATKNPKVTSSTLNSFGNLKASQGDLPSAIGFYEEAIRSAAGSGARTLEATSRTNLANAMARNGAFDKAVKLNAGALQLASQLDNSHEKAFCLLRAGKTWELLFEKEPSHPAQRRVAALRAYEDAARLAATIGDDRALSFSLGYAGHLYEQEKKMDDALRLTARATSFAQGLKSPDILYQWEWQAGRILRAQRQFNAAIDAFGRSVESLEKIRTGLSTHLGNANARSSYRGAVSDAYFSLADLLLARADRQQDGAKAEKDVREACEVCEKLKSVELADYFQDDCVNLLQKKKEDIFKANPNKRGGKSGDDIWGEGFPGTAIVYFIPLPDRIETIVRLGGEFHRRKVQVGSEVPNPSRGLP